MNAVECKNLGFRYITTEKDILKNFNLQIEEKQIFLLTGPTGCGKSTFCLCLNGIIPQKIQGEYHGSITVFGKDPSKIPVNEMAKTVGIAFQNPTSQIFSTTIEDEVAIGPENLGLTYNEIEERLEQSLDFVGIKHLKKRSPFELSAGQIQRVAIASILAMRSEILVFDEPTAYLDPRMTKEFMNIVKRMKDEGKTIIITEHDMNLTKFVDKVGVMNKSGEIIAVDDPDEIWLKKEVISVIDPPQLQYIFYKANLRIPKNLNEAQNIIKNITQEVRFESSQKEVSLSFNPIVKVHDLNYIYPNGIKSIDNLDLRIYENEFIALLGPNGAGKTTLSFLIAGLLKPTKGVVKIYNKDIQQLSTKERIKLVSYVFQNPDYQLFLDDVKQEIEFGLNKIDINENEKEDIINNALKSVGLSDRGNEFPFNLSVGQKKKLTIACILALSPKIMIIDEPGCGTDWRTLREILNLLKQRTKKDLTVILCTHNVEMASEYANRIIVLKDGKIVKDGPPRDVFIDLAKLQECSLEIPTLCELSLSLADDGFPFICSIHDFEDLIRRAKSDNQAF